MTRHVLQPRPDDDPQKIQELAAKGLDPHGFPFTDNPNELAANRLIQENPMESTLNIDGTPSVSSTLVPAWLAHTAAVLGSLLMLVVALVPAPYNGLLALFGAGAMYLGGKGLQMPTWAEGKPLVPLALVPLLGGASAALGVFAAQLPPNFEKTKATLTLVAGVLMWAAGKASPAPTLSPAK